MHLLKDFPKELTLLSHESDYAAPLNEGQTKTESWKLEVRSSNPEMALCFVVPRKLVLWVQTSSFKPRAWV
jgi:hypothetical protein